MNRVVGESKHGSNDCFESFLTGFAENLSAELEHSEQILSLRSDVIDRE